jgi:hypothetical protein
VPAFSPMISPSLPASVIVTDCQKNYYSGIDWAIDSANAGNMKSCQLWLFMLAMCIGFWLLISLHNCANVR